MGYAVRTEPYYLRDISMKTEAAYKAEQRARKRDAGLVVVEVWCRPADKERVRRYVARLVKGGGPQVIPDPCTTPP